MAKNEDTYSYRGWLVSDSLLKRAFAVWGHHIVASLVVAGIMMGFTLIISLLFGAGSILFRGFGG